LVFTLLREARFRLVKRPTHRRPAQGSDAFQQSFPGNEPNFAALVSFMQHIVLYILEGLPGVFRLPRHQCASNGIPFLLFFELEHKNNMNFSKIFRERQGN